MIYLYHGTDREFACPIPDMGRLGTDFGQGFYLTPDFASAANMARRIARRKNTLEAVVLCYKLDENRLASAKLRVKSFLNIERDWLRFVVANRYLNKNAMDHNLDKRYDIVHGYIADDRIVRLLDSLVKNLATEEDVLNVLLASQFKSIQYSFHSKSAIDLLERIEVKHV